MIVRSIRSSVCGIFIFVITVAITIYSISKDRTSILIGCDETRNGTLESHETLYFNFKNLAEQSVTFTNCDSDFDTVMYLKDAEGNKIQSQSRNQCDGDQCYDEAYVCAVNDKETFTMEMLDIGNYVLELGTVSDGGTFDVQILCNTTLNTQNSIECGQMITGNTASGQSVLFEFVNTKKQNVLFTNCGSDNWALPTYALYLMNSDREFINNQSTNQCDGTDCFLSSVYCDEYDESDLEIGEYIWKSASILMSDLEIGEYILEIQNLRYSETSYAVEVVCDPVPCNRYGSSQTTSEFKCVHFLQSIDSVYSAFCDGDSTLSILDIQQIQASYQFVRNVGIGIDSNVLLLSLLLVNVSTAIFIMYGFQQLSLDVNINTVTSIIVVTQLLLVTSFLSFTFDQFGTCSRVGTMLFPTVFHLLILMIGSILFFCWFYWTPCTNRYCCVHECPRGLSSCVVSILIFIMFLCSWWLRNAENHGKTPDFVVLFFFFFFQSLIPLYLTTLTSPCRRICETECCQSILFQSMCLSFFVPMTLLVAWLLSYIFDDHWYSDFFQNHFTKFCSVIGGFTWLNPFFVLSSLYLLFSEFRILTLLQNSILLIIFLSARLSDSVYFCSAVVNVQYIVHSFFIPIYIFFLFRSIKQLRPLSMSLIGAFLVAFDVFTDLVVAFYFIEERMPIFAALQMLFIITGQVVGAIVDVFGDEMDEVTRTDKVMALLGFGRIWFTVNWWKERMTQDGTGRYKVLRQKHKIWDLLYDSFPTVALQVYAARTSNVPATALVFSIVLSAVSVSFSTILYLATLLAVGKASDAQEAEHVEAQQENVLRSVSLTPERMPSNESMIDSPKPPTYQMPSESLYLNLFIFMASDFVIRTIPTVLLLALISTIFFNGGSSTDSVWRSVFGIFIYGPLVVFEFIANYKMRIPSHRGFTFILKIFATSTFSSFHTMLCTLSILEDDPFYAKSVIFSKYMVEHGVRVAAAIMFCIICLALTDLSSWYPWVLTALFMISMICNGLSMKCIYELEAVEAIKQHIVSEKENIEEPAVQSVELQTMESKQTESEEVVTEIGGNDVENMVASMSEVNESVQAVSGDAVKDEILEMETRSDSKFEMVVNSNGAI